MIRSWRLDDARQTLVLGSRDDRLAEITYWGPRLPDAEDLDTLCAAHRLDVTGGMLDENPELSICPEASRSFPGQPGLVLRGQDGALLLPRFRFAGEEAAPGRLVLSYRDAGLGLDYTAQFEIDAETGMIEARARLDSDAPVRLDWLAAPVFPAPQSGDERIDVSGRWCGEFQLNRTPWSPGQHVRESRTGRTGHEHFPGLILPDRGTTDTRGTACAFHYGWSGGHRMVAEELPDGRRQIQWGHATGTEIGTGTRFETAPLYAAISDQGLNGCATAFQRYLRDRIVTWPRPGAPRPVHYNCWEAVYFDHDLAELKDIATRAATLGAERFVLDDGWFGRRDDDTTSLGDWEVDPRKYPDGLGPLIEHVQSLGMGFGIWFEPEMVNRESELFRAHPDWVLGPADQILGRGQMVLDMARDDVRAYLFDRIGKVLSDNDIDYVKWDHNRVLPMPDAAQTRGTYALLDALRAAFPAVEIESCASGGGRIDFGILSRTQRVWLSDSNDALERLRIQHDAALFLPAAVTGSVGMKPTYGGVSRYGAIALASGYSYVKLAARYGDEPLTEDATMGKGFLAELCRDWEQAALPAKEAGIRVVLGTDSRASNPDLNLWKEVQFLLNHRTDLDPYAILKMATVAGADALLGAGSEIGTITAGSTRIDDLVSLETDGKTLDQVWHDFAKRELLCTGVVGRS